MNKQRKIIGISLVKNEDIYIGQSLANVLDFCDEIIVYDNNSKDGTVEIVNKYVKKYPCKVKLKHILNLKESQTLLDIIGFFELMEMNYMIQKVLLF